MRTGQCWPHVFKSVRVLMHRSHHRSSYTVSYHRWYYVVAYVQSAHSAVALVISPTLFRHISCYLHIQGILCAEVLFNIYITHSTLLLYIYTYSTVLPIVLKYADYFTSPSVSTSRVSIQSILCTEVLFNKYSTYYNIHYCSIRYTYITIALLKSSLYLPAFELLPPVSQPSVVQ